MLIKQSTIPAILEHIESLQLREGEVVMLLFGAHDNPDIPELIAALNQKKVTFLGGIFPGIIYGNRWFSQGCMVQKLAASGQPFCIKGISTQQFDGLLDTDAMVKHRGGQTAIVLLDSLTPHVNGFLEKLNNQLGEQCRFIGAGAGYMDLVRRPCIFCNHGFFEDGAVVCVIPNEVILGVRHGWEKLAGPLVATETDGHSIKQLNWQKAIDVYREIVEADCGITLTRENFFSISPGYPLGIFREKEDDIVRDPISFNEKGEIICIGEVPANTVLHVLKGRTQTLLSAAKQAIDDCGQRTGFPIKAHNTFVVECITRNLFLGSEFAQEIDYIRNNLEVHSEEQEPYGVLSMGEISSYGDGLLELFNKTIVVGVFI